MKTNLEKWLPDTPDREKWSQEESLTDKDKEAPMAELPGELEDLVGDLMEEEEDLFDEMEDVSSSAIDSLDKGAGWDAHGRPDLEHQRQGRDRQPPAQHQRDRRPVRRRAARQVERRVRRRRGGRQGRPQDAQPAHARPVRQGPDQGPQQGPRRAGPPAAARRAARAAKGSKAPRPAAPANATCQRLAGKQAALRNKAEGVDLQFQVANFHHTDLKKMIDMMAAGRARSEGRPLPERPAPAAGAAAEGWATSSSTSKASSRSGRTPPPTCPPTSRRKSSAACRTPRPPAGRNSTASTSSGSPPAATGEAVGEQRRRKQKKAEPEQNSAGKPDAHPANGSLLVGPLCLHPWSGRCWLLAWRLRQRWQRPLPVVGRGRRGRQEGRHSLRFRLEVRRRPLRPDGRRHDLEEAASHEEVHRSRVDARRARLLRQPQASAVPETSLEKMKKIVQDDFGAQSASGEASSGPRGPRRRSTTW